MRKAKSDNKKSLMESHIKQFRRALNTRMYNPRGGRARAPH
jgi:hypothetical protein